MTTALAETLDISEPLGLTPRYDPETRSLHYTWQPTPDFTEDNLCQLAKTLRPCNGIYGHTIRFLRSDGCSGFPIGLVFYPLPPDESPSLHTRLRQHFIEIGLVTEETIPPTL